MKRLALLIFSALCIQSCATLSPEEQAQIEKELTPVPAAPSAPAVAAAPAPEAEEEEPLTRYSELNNMAPPSDRQYKRMTRQKMEEESELYSSAGSLWKMEGQTSYLFAENKHRREGDPTSIKMEGAALKMIENKALVIQDLLSQLEVQKLQAEEDEKHAAEEKLRLSQIEEEKKLKAERIAKGELVVDPMDAAQQELDAAAEAQAAAERKPAAVVAAAGKKDKEDKIDLKAVESIPSKIVEKMNDDIYRIRGQQYLTIKKKPYKVIATALVRAEDFNDNGVSSTKLLDAQYDVIHVKRAAE